MNLEQLNFAWKGWQLVFVLFTIVVNSPRDARQKRPDSIPSRARFFTAALPESSLQKTSIDLQSTLTLFLSRMDNLELNITNVIKTNNLHERITAQEQDKVSLYVDSFEYQGDDMDEEVRHSSEELRTVNTEIDLTVGEVVRDQAEAMSTCEYNSVTGLFNQNSSVPQTFCHSSSHSPSQDVKTVHSAISKRKIDDENDLNVLNNKIIYHIVTEEESSQAYGTPILENLASVVTKFWQTEARNEQKIKKLKNEYLVATNCPMFYVPTLNE